MTENELAALLDQALPDRAFLYPVPQNVREPYLVFMPIIATPQNSLCGYEDLDQVRYQVDSYAKTRAEAKANMKTVRQLLDAQDDEASVNIEQGFYEQDTRLYRVMVDFSTWDSTQEVRK